MIDIEAIYQSNNSLMDLSPILVPNSEGIAGIVNPVIIVTVLKVYLSSMIVFLNILSIILLIPLLPSISFHNSYVVDPRSNVVSCFMMIIVIMVSPIVILNPIDHSSVIESILFLVYIFPLLVPTILSTLPRDLTITFPNRDRIGLISYLLTNYW